MKGFPAANSSMWTPSSLSFWLSKQNVFIILFNVWWNLSRAPWDSGWYVLDWNCFMFNLGWWGPHATVCCREAFHASLRCSPFELVFGHSVGSLFWKKWLCENTVISILDYVEYFKYKLKRACEIEKDNFVKLFRKNSNSENLCQLNLHQHLHALYPLFREALWCQLIYLSFLSCRRCNYNII
jgi:hypothetical protein